MRLPLFFRDVPFLWRYAGPAPVEFRSSRHYWERRYRQNCTSGAGSYGRLAEFKAEVINAFVDSNDVKSVIEFGCGDGNQLSLATYRSYLGLDVSAHAVKSCRQRFANDKSKSFAVIDSSRKVPVGKFEAALSLDVIYHLVEDSVFEQYMRQLFGAATRFVIVYSSNDNTLSSSAVHVRHRCFTEWVSQAKHDWRLAKHIPNRYPFDPTSPIETSFADFYFFEKCQVPVATA